MQPDCEASVQQSARLLQNIAEAKAYMQYVAFNAATQRYVPVLLTDGNNMALYIHNARLDEHQRMYWGFGQILDASCYLAELVKQIARDNPARQPYNIGHDDRPESPQDLGTEHEGPGTTPEEHSMGHDESKHNASDNDNSVTNVESNSGTPTRTTRPMSMNQQWLSDMQDAEMQVALRVARFHPCVTPVYGLPRYSKPISKPILWIAIDILIVFGCQSDAHPCRLLFDICDLC